MDDPGRRGKQAGLGGGPFVEPDPESQQQVTAGYCHIGGVAAVHPQHPQVLGEGIGHGPFPHQGGDHRDPGFSGQFRKHSSGARQDHPASGHDHRTVGPAEGFRRPPDIGLPGMETPLVAQEMDLLGILEIQSGIEHVGDDVDEHRSRPAGPGNVKGFFQHLGQVLHLPDQIVVFGDGSGDPCGVRLLEGILTDQGGGHLTADDHQGNGIHVGGGNPRHHVADPGAAGGNAHPHLSGGPGVPVRRVDGPLFVAGEDMGKVGFVNGIIQAQYGPSRVAENHRDLFCFETCKDGFCAGHFHKRSSFNAVSFSTGPWYRGPDPFQWVLVSEPGWGKSI